MPLCRNCGEENPQHARFCLACAAPLELAAESRQEEVRKTVTIVFCDLTGSTALGERLDPESVRQVMSRFYGSMRSALERHGGKVEKFIGDAVMAVFGVPVLHEDDAARGVRAAFEMREELERLNVELEERWDIRLETRTGVNTGEVVAKNESEGESFVVGDAVNVAARLEQAAAPGQILIGENTFRLVRDAVRVKSVGGLDLKGKTAPVEGFEVTDVVKAAPGTARRLDSPIVGRDEELTSLREAFERVKARAVCELLTVTGPAGVGKSRLTEAFLDSLGDGAFVLQGRCLPYGEGITFWPLAEAIKTAAHVDDSDPADQAQAKIKALMAHQHDGPAVAERVAGALGLSERSSPPEETFWAIRRLLEVLAADRPLVVVFDDIHWAEPTFLDLLEYVSSFSRDAPMLLVCLARPELLELRPAWGAGAGATTLLTVAPLGEVESASLIENLLGEAPLDKEAAARITRAAEGNPLFLEELLRMLIEDRVLHEKDGSWQAAQELSDLSVPATIQALLAARLDRLRPPERSVLERAAVVGQVFWRGAVSELSPEPIKAGIWSSLQGLVRKELVRPDQSVLIEEDAFRFGHILIRDAAYEGMLKEARAELHERFAAWLEQKVGNRLPEFEEVIAHHLEQAYRYRLALGAVGEGNQLAVRAGRLLASAGNRAFARGDMPATLKLLARAAELLSSDDPAWFDAKLLVGLAALQVGDLPKAEATLEETATAARAHGDRGLELHARVELANLRMMISPEGSLEQLRSVAEYAIPYFEQTGDHFRLARTWRHLADVPHMSGRMNEALDALERALEHARLAGNAREEGEILVFFAGALYMTVFYGPMPVPEGVTRCGQIMRSLPDGQGEGLMSDFSTRALVAAPVSSIEAMQGRFDEARRVCAQATKTLDELGQKFILALGRQIFAWVEILAEDFAAAEQELRLSFETLDAIGERSAFSTVAAMLALTSFEQERYEEAESFTRVSEEAAGPADVASQVLWRAVRARLLAQRGDMQAAEALAQDALQIAEQGEGLNVQGDAFLTLAGVLRPSKPAEAEAAAREALERYNRKGNVVSAAKADAFLALVRSA